MRLIDADALGIGKAKRDVFNNPAYADGWNSAIEIIKNAPTIEARPVVRGEWEYMGYLVAKCSACSKVLHGMGGGNFCPNCGADMRGEEDGEA